MKSSHVQRHPIASNKLFAAMAALTFAAAPAVHAASDSWDGSTDAIWATGTNWSLDTTAPGAGETATFNGAGNGNTTIDLGAGVTVGTVLFDTASAAAYTIGSGAVGSQTLTLSTLNSGLTLNSTVAANQLVNANIALATTGNYNFTNNSLTNTLTVAGGISASTTGNKTLTVTGSGNTIISGAITNGSGTAVAVTKSGTGAVTLSGANTFTGSITVAGGTLTLSNTVGTNTSNGNFRVGTVTNTPAILNITPSTNITNRFNLFVGDAGAGTGGGAVYQSGGTLTLTQVASIDNLRIGSNAGGYGYYKLSAGSLTANEAGIGASLANTVGVMDVSGGSFTSNGWIVLGRGSQTSSGLLNVTGGTVEFSKVNGAADANNSRLGLQWGNSSGAQSVVNIANGSVTGDDYIDLAVTNTAGTLGAINLLSGGLLQGSRVTAAAANPTALLNFNGGTLRAHTTNAGVNFMTSGNIDAVTVYSGGGTIDNNGTNITVGRPLAAASGNGVTSIAVTDGGSGYIGAPMVKISGGTGNTATGYAVMVDDGTGKGTYRVSSIVITNPGTYSVDPTTVTLSGGGTSTTATLGAITTGANSTTGGMSFTGSGTTTLSGVNTYTGDTTIGAGSTLALASTGSIANSAAIIANGTFNVTAVTGFAIGASQTLKGSGTVTGATTVNGTLAPGNSPGVITFSGDLSLGASSTSVFEINGLTRGTEYDGVDVGGALSYGGTMSLVFDAPINAGTYDLFGGFSGQSGTFAAVSVGGSFAQALNAPANITGSGWSASSPSWSYVFDNATGDLVISAVPEPSTFAALAGLAGLGAVVARRRRRVST